MTATAVQVSQQAGVSEKEWVRLFPKEVTENYTSSITFIKQLTVVAVSTITYLKNAFPEESYFNETFGGLKLKILKEKCQDELAQFMSTSMQQAFDAFDKKYVHQLALCFYRGECSADNLIEYHVFEYAYSGRGEGASVTVSSQSRGATRTAMLVRSLDAVRTRTAMLVRSLSLFVWQNCTQELPHNYDVSLRLYYNEDSPEAYQAPGFGPSPEPDHLAATAGDALCLGWVETPFHKLVARSFVRDLCNYNSDAAAPSDNLPEMSQDGSDDFQGWARSSQSPEPEPEPEPEHKLEPEREPRVRCPCAVADLDQALVTCQYCHTQQHAACFGLLAPVAEHCCAACARQDAGRDPTCALLAELSTRRQECLCVFRRVLVLCCGRPALAGAELAAWLGLRSTAAGTMLRLLQSHGVLDADSHPHDLTIYRKINPIRLKLTMKRFFRAEEDESTGERGAAESGSAELAAPVADATLRQYRAALAPAALAPAPAALAPAPAAQAPAPAAQAPAPAALAPAPAALAPAPAGRALKRKQDGEEHPDPTKLPKLRSGTKTKKRV